MTEPQPDHLIWRLRNNDTANGKVMSKGITYRLVRELHESCNERGAMNLSLELCSAEQFSMHVGPHPGFDEPRSLVVGVKFFGADPTFLELAFSPDDDLPARQLAEALTAWADWIEATTDQAPESTRIDEENPQ